MYHDVGSGIREEDQEEVSYMKHYQLVHVVPDVCRGHIWDEHKGAEVDPMTQLLFPGGPGEEVSLQVC